MYTSDAIFFIGRKKGDTDSSDCRGAAKEVGTWLIIGQLLRASQASRCYGIIYKKGSNVTSW